MKVFGIAGWSGAGKTTLIEHLIPELAGRGLRVSVVKHTHRAFDIDHPGKDSWRHRHAGAAEVMVGSSGRWALMHELRGEREPGLVELLERMSPCDIVLVEGFRDAPVPKLEVFRPSLGHPALHDADPMVVAIASDAPLPAGGLPLLDLNHPAAVAEFILVYLGSHVTPDAVT